MRELVGIMVGPYFLLECLGREGMVETYRARPTTRGGYDVLLRLFKPQFPDPTEFREHFAAEAEKVLHCQHEHIQPLLEFGAGEDLLYSVTEVTAAETLEQFLGRQAEGILAVPQVIEIVVQLCAALQYAHERGIVHGNVQPGSILIGGQVGVQLTHFGLRHAYREGEVTAAQIEEGNSAYRAPEQSLGMPCPASDIYALGVLLYQLLTGRLPYDGEDAAEFALKHAEEPVPGLRALRPELPETLELVVRVALAKSPEARFPTPAALAQALLAAVTPGASPIATVLPQRRVIMKPRYPASVWMRASSIMALLIVLFGLASTLLFVFTPMQQSSIGKWLRDTDNRFVLPGWSTTSTSVVTPGTDNTPGTGPVSRIGPTATTGVSHKPMPGSTASPAPPLAPSPTPGYGPTPNTITCGEGAISIDGAPGLEPLLQQVNRDYQTLCPGVSITLHENGGVSAISALLRSQIDIVAADVAAGKIGGLSDRPVGAIVYAVIVSPDVQINNLGSAALMGIYHGQITNWAQVGGPDEAITVVQRPPRDPVTAVFRAFVLHGMRIHVHGMKLHPGQADLVVPSVAQLKGAISVVPLGEVEESNVQVVSIDGVLPGVQGVEENGYAFWSVGHLYTQGDGTPQTRAYIQFLNSEQETGDMMHFSVIPMSVLPQGVVASHVPGAAA